MGTRVSVSILSNDEFGEWPPLPKGWNHTVKTTKTLHFETSEVVDESEANIIFKRIFQGNTWYLKISKIL
jgi:hypothetical protein